MLGAAAVVTTWTPFLHDHIASKWFSLPAFYFIAALPRLVHETAEVMHLHERGEHQAALWLEPGWADLREGLTDMVRPYEEALAATG